METTWFVIVVATLSMYLVLDGFDFGVGALHLFVAKTEAERVQVISAIGPFWDGNEVWLIAAGGLLLFAFPKAYAIIFSGFYLPVIMLLWLLVLRGIAIEFRSQEANSLWHTFWDTTFCFSSAIIAILLGATLANIVRGCPLTESGYFAGPLFTDFTPGTNPGILDWYTVSIGIFALLTLCGHGALYLCWKTSGAVQQRSLKLARLLWPAIFCCALAVTWMTQSVRPEIYCNLLARPWTWSLALIVFLALTLVFLAIRGGHELLAFCSSALFIFAILAVTAAGMYPNMLISSIDPTYTLTVQSAASSTYGLNAGLAWWSAAIILVGAYFSILFFAFRGKVHRQ